MSGMSETATANSRRARRTAVRRRRVVRWVVFGVVVLLIAVVLWIGIRGLLAREQLTGAIPGVETLKSRVLAGDTEGLDSIAADLTARATTAAALTSDPVWRAAEVIPILGPNLTAFREAAEVIRLVTEDALPPALALADDLDFADFLPRDGAIHLAGIEALGPRLDEAAAAMDAAQSLAAGIRTEHTVPQIGEAVEQLLGAVGSASELIAGLDGAVGILPGMLGADGERTHLVLVQNNAELRSSGGIPGAAMEIVADGGRVELGEYQTASDLGRFDPPAVPATEREDVLYAGVLTSFLQNATNTPDFPRAAEIARTMWRDRVGTEVDGVLALDPVALSYVLEAMGPVTLPDGTVLDAANVVEELLSGVYARFPEPADQDAFFAMAARAVFAAVMSGSGEPKAFIAAIGRAVAEHRILVWSAHEEEQTVIERARAIATMLPAPAGDATGLGVYLADNTAAKMDWYLRSGIAIGSIECRNDDRPYFEVRVRLESLAPADADAVLPDYVTGSSAGIRAPGDIRTTVYLFAPEGALVYDVREGDAPQAFFTAPAEEGQPTAVAYTAYLEPGQSTVVRFSLIGAAGSSEKVRLVHTPTAFPVETSVDNPLECLDLEGGPDGQITAKASVPVVGVQAASGGRPSGANGAASESLPAVNILRIAPTSREALI